MNYYLIDLENVQSRGLYGTDLLGSDDCIIIFYSSTCNMVSSQTAGLLLSGSARLLLQNVNVHTKNAMDFELAVTVGKLLADGDCGAIFVISEDNGYKAVLEAGNKIKQGKVRQYRSILEAWYQEQRSTGNGGNVSVKSVMKEINKRRTLADMAALLCADPEILSDVINSSGKDFRKLYQGLLHAFGRAGGLRLYRKMKNDGLGPFSSVPWKE